MSKDPLLNANASLIVNSPKLLQGLKLACEVLRTKGEVDLAVSLERDIIAKAEGK